jgi:hypothetical protein
LANNIDPLGVNMKKTIIQSGIVLGSILSIAPSVNAQSIANGDYSDVYAGSYVIQVRNNKFRVATDEPGPLDPWKSISKAGFKPIKSGVFYAPTIKHITAMTQCIRKNVLPHDALVMDGDEYR